MNRGLRCASVIWAVPAVALDQAAIDVDKREAARQFTAEDVFNALTSKLLASPASVGTDFTGGAGSEDVQF